MDLELTFIVCVLRWACWIIDDICLIFAPKVDCGAHGGGSNLYSKSRGRGGGS